MVRALVKGVKLPESSSTALITDRKKALWVTKNDALLSDTKRDIKAVHGSDESVIEYKGGKAAAKTLENDSGIMFATYGAISYNFNEDAQNLNNIVNWLGKDYDGVIVFDESHPKWQTPAVKELHEA